MHAGNGAARAFVEIRSDKIMPQSNLEPQRHRTVHLSVGW
jgi:hypothetical protein